uniref:Uncharacterized protein n=1 Tax=Anguilla anguilla TaxID=7936 RepID=A0A0E9PGU4_ANGAN
MVTACSQHCISKAQRNARWQFDP